MSIPAHLILDRSVTYFYFRVAEDGKIVYANDTFENHLSHIQPKSIFDFVTIEQDKETLLKAFSKAKSNSTFPVVSYFRIKQKNGAQRWLLWEVYEAGAVYHFLGNALYDVVSIKAYEYDQIRALLETIAWEWSHRTRRPLTSVIGLARLLEKNENITEQDKEAVSMLLASARELDEVIEKLTDILSKSLPDKE